MIVGDGTYELHGTEAQKAILLGCFVPGDPSFIAFPWDRLDPPSTPIPIGWMDLNASHRRAIWGPGRGSPGTDAAPTDRLALGVPDHEHLAPIEIPGHVHVLDGHGNEGHGILRRIDGRWWIAGVFWTDGRIYVDTRCESQPALAREVVAAELAHSVDYFLPLTDSMKASLMALWHEADEGGADAHTWWEIHDYGGEYYTLGGEAFMAAWTMAYSSIAPDQSAFSHKAEPDEAARVREILGVPRVDEPEPVEPSFRVGRGRKRHRAICWTVLVARVLGRRVEPAPRDLPPCRICRPQ